jgi:hypothetical protein
MACRSLLRSGRDKSIDSEVKFMPEEESKPTTDNAAPAAKKEKAPALEDKPFTEFIEQDFIPTLSKAITEQGVTDFNLRLERAKPAIVGWESAVECAQVVGNWAGGLKQVKIYFFDDNIQGQRGISCVDRGSKPSTIESFLIDERKITLDLLIFGVLRRLNGQKWLQRN